jgi:hypothetical protein
MGVEVILTWSYCESGGYSGIVEVEAFWYSHMVHLEWRLFSHDILRWRLSSHGIVGRKLFCHPIVGEEAFLSWYCGVEAILT